MARKTKKALQEELVEMEKINSEMGIELAECRKSAKIWWVKIQELDGVIENYQNDKNLQAKKIGELVLELEKERANGI